MADARTKSTISYTDFYSPNPYPDSYSPASSHVYAACSTLAGRAFRETCKMIMTILKIMSILVDKKASRTT